MPVVARQGRRTARRVVRRHYRRLRVILVGSVVILSIEDTKQRETISCCKYYQNQYVFYTTNGEEIVGDNVEFTPGVSCPRCY